MNKDEFIGKLQMVYVGDRNAFNEIVEDNQRLKNLLVYSKVEIDRLNKEYERIYNENCKLRENHNINDITLLDENERLNNIIKELSKDVDMWNKKYNEQFDIINELEKYIIGETELNNGALLCGLSSDTEKDQYGIENNIYDNILDKLKELKENK